MRRNLSGRAAEVACISSEEGMRLQARRDGDGSRIGADVVMPVAEGLVQLARDAIGPEHIFGPGAGFRGARRKA
jgi:hypothetical protein